MAAHALQQAKAARRSRPRARSSGHDPLPERLAGGSPSAHDEKRRHRGDIMSPAKRSALMARIRGKDTGPELRIAALLAEQAPGFETHARDLPGRPDFVFREQRVAVLVDGDFWHGWRFHLWRDKLSPAWEAKIASNRLRDARNRRRLRSLGWVVIRVWEHQIERDAEACIARIRRALAVALSNA